MTDPLRRGDRTPLEERYRRALAVLPASYRAQWEEEMVATFLESMQTGDREDDEYVAYNGRPGRAERASILALAVRLRLGGTGAPPRSIVWGRAVRQVVLAWLLVTAVGATIGVVQDVWIAGRIPWPPIPVELRAAVDSTVASPLDVASRLASLLWVAAFFALVLGQRHVTRVCAGIALVPAVVTTVASTVSMAVDRLPLTPFTVTAWTDLAVSMGMVLALAAFHREAPPVRPGPWLRAYALGLVVMLAVAVLFLAQPLRGVLVLDWPGVWSLAVVVAGALHLLRPVFGQGSRDGSWSITLAVLAGVAFLLRTASLLDYGLVDMAGAGGSAVAIGVVEAVAVVAVGVPLARAAARTLAALPEAPYGSRMGV